MQTSSIYVSEESAVEREVESDYQEETSQTEESCRGGIYGAPLPDDDVVLRLYHRCRNEEAAPPEKESFEGWIRHITFRRCNHARKEGWRFDEEQRQEFVEEVTVKVWIKWMVEKIEFENPPPTVGQLVEYVNRATDNTIRDHFDRKERSNFSLNGPSGQEDGRTLADALGDEMADPDPDPEAVALRNELKRRVREAISKLPPREQQIIEFSYLDELPSQAIAKILGISDSRVRQILGKARNELKKMLQDYYTL